jgi:hypothetical protein
MCLHLAQTNHVSAESPSISPLTPQKKLKKPKKKPKNSPPRGPNFYPNFYYFFLGAHAKFGNPTTTLSGRTVMAVEREKRERERKVNDYSGTIVSERRRWRTHTLGPKDYYLK